MPGVPSDDAPRIDWCGRVVRRRRVAFSEPDRKVPSVVLSCNCQQFFLRSALAVAGSNAAGPTIASFVVVP
jgi:hypothetical protein